MNYHQTTDALLRGRRIPATALIVALSLVVICFVAIGARTLASMKTGQWDLARQVGQNITAAIEADIARNIELYDLSLRNVANNLLVIENHGLNRALRHQVLFDHAATARHFGPIRVLGSDGSLLLDAGNLFATPSSFAYEDFFTVHKRSANAGLYVGPPVADERGLYEVPFSRRISRDDGSFAGVVVGSIKITYFHDIFRRLDVPDGDAMTLVNSANRLIMRRPFDIGMLGRDLGNVPGVARSLASRDGWIEGAGAIDVTPRLYVWTAGEHFRVVSGQSLQRIYGPWRDEALTIGGMMGVLVLIVLAITSILIVEMRARRGLQERLAAMATTDALTGLANRRHFDDVMLGEWKRARRTRAPLSLLIIDADHFKHFNDMFGHPAGDAVLRNIARCVAVVGQREGDCAARYGGEEFALILPNTPHQAALKIAEAVRAEVASLPADRGAITVSIGVATCVPSRARQTADLIETADRALYAAKRSGRNCVMGSELDSLRLAG